MRTMLRLRLVPGPTAPRLARLALRGLPARVQALVPSLELLVSELVTNSVVHAHLRSSDDIELAVYDGGGYVRVEVVDAGTGYDEAQDGWRRAPSLSDGGPLSRHGLGIPVVNRIADRSGVIWDMGTVAWFEMNLPGDDVDARSA
jgi:anti-sigma regulatory factor (Ser/Thr protein kinase)